MARSVNMDGIHRMKHLATMIQECADETGYSYEFLNSAIDEVVEDGTPLLEATEEVLAIAYEYDF